MSEFNRRNRLTVNRRAQRGQALIIVLAVMFILLFIGTIFIAQISRNIQQSGRSVQTQIANTLAEAGIRYCDEQLTYTGDGADWRPTPTPPVTMTDPDYQWLQEGYSRISLTGGRALVRVVYTPGSTNLPDSGAGGKTIPDPRGGLLRIESIGRPGEVGDGQDPTLFVQTGAAPRLRKELIAYKQIGLTDYGLYVTNKNKTSVEAAIGAPSVGVPLAFVLGDPDVAANPNKATPSFPMRINSDVRFYGNTFLYESQRGTGDSLLTADTLLTSGKIKFDGQNTRLFVNRELNVTNMPPAMLDSDVLTGIGFANAKPGCVANPSSDNPECGFDSKNALIRTGSEQPDANGYTQNIRALPPPSLNYIDKGTGVLRYRLLTRDTGAWSLDANGVRFRQGQDGWGTGIYVNNPADFQPESNNAGSPSSYSLRADWLNPKAQFAQNYWQGPYYRPPGVLIELLGDRIRITRTDNDSFYEPDGSLSQKQGGKVIEIPLSDYERKQYRVNDGTDGGKGKLVSLQIFPHDSDERNGSKVATQYGLTNPYKHSDTYGVNVVIMAEGNVRVRGVYGVDASKVAEISNDPDTEGSTKLERVHLTIVSGHTAYIEGNIVKGDPDRASTCAILAHDYVCVNPTVFVAPQNQTHAWERHSEDLDSFSQNIPQGESADVSFSFGLDPALYGGTLNLLTRHASADPGGLPSLINLRINPAVAANATSANGYYDFTKGLPAPVGNPLPPAYFYSYYYQVTTPLNNFEARPFPLATSGANYQLITAPGYENLLSFAPTVTAVGSGPLGAGGNYAFGGVMVTPLDIRIEALLYAEERSFFVIPGYSFNPNAGDTLQAYNYHTTYDKDGNVISNREKQRPDGVFAEFPFYNEPVDARITIYGAVSENYTASISDQAAWMARWGYIPVHSGVGVGIVGAIPTMHQHGVDPDARYGVADNGDYRTKDEADANIARGMRLLYDPALALPYLNSAGGAAGTNNPLRFIARKLTLQDGITLIGAGTIKQTLPSVPKLPVCPGLLYMGDPDRPLN